MVAVHYVTSPSTTTFNNTRPLSAMNVSRVLLILCGIALYPGHAAPPKGKSSTAPASLLFVNAVTDRGFAFMVIDEEDMQPQGFRTGVATGWFQLEGAKHDIVIEHQPLGLVKQKLDLKPGSFQAVIAHNLSVSQDEKGRPPKPTIGTVVLSCNPDLEVKKSKENSRPLTVINVASKETVVVEAGEETLTALRLEPTVIQVKADAGFLPIRLVEGPKADPETVAGAPTDPPPPLVTFNMEDGRSFYVVLYDTESGEVAATSFQLTGTQWETASESHAGP